MGLKRSILNYKEFWEIAEVGGIARRYFAINMFDAILTIIGILVASFFANVENLKIVASAAIGASIAMTVSGVWGAYLTERAERQGKIKSLEKKIAVNLRKSPIGEAHKFASIFLGLVDGLLPLFATPIMIFPLFMKIPVNTAYIFSLSISFFLLFIIGAYLGKISKENLLKAGLKMTIIGIVCAIIIYVAEKLIL